LKEIKRTKKIKHLYFQSGNKIKKIHYKNFLKRNKIHDLIKLTPQEFILAIKKKTFFHFNLQTSVHKKKKNYYLVKILKHGSSDKRKYVDPILSPKLFILVTCTASKNFVSFEKIRRKELTNSLLIKRSKKGLKLSILKKYKKILSHIDDDTKIKMGISVSKLVNNEKIKNIKLI
jgi:hypothetical protein